MANERGFLPKARREDLSDETRGLLDRWYRNAYQDDNLFLTMARRPGLLGPPEIPCAPGRAPR